MVTAKWYVIIYFLGAVYIYVAWLMTQLVRWKSGQVFTNFPYLVPQKIKTKIWRREKSQQADPLLWDNVIMMP